jgi:predicted RecA/RadA family phage recombinase
MKKLVLICLALLAGLAFTGIATAMGWDAGSSSALGFVGVGMAANYIHEGDVLDLTAPYAVSSGDGAQVGSIFGVAINDLANGVAGPFARCGVFDLTALSTATGSQGVKAYWDDTNKRVDTDGTVGILIGVLEVAKVNGDTTARVVLNEAVTDASEGPQAAEADIATANATDLASAVALSNANKGKINAILAKLRTFGVISA